MLTLLLKVIRIEALPGGAPTLACRTMVPVHYEFKAQDLSNSPFGLLQSERRYVSNEDHIAVSLYSLNSLPHSQDVKGNGRSFRGFLVKAINPHTGSPIGEFEPKEGIKILDRCSAVTHSDNTVKKQETLYWKPSREHVDPEAPNYVSFIATVVEDFRTFYVGIESRLFNGTLAKRFDTDPPSKLVSNNKEDKVIDEGNNSHPHPTTTVSYPLATQSGATNGERVVKQTQSENTGGEPTALMNADRVLPPPLTTPTPPFEYDAHTTPEDAEYDYTDNQRSSFWFVK